jgi:hypothetical protein
VRGLKDVSSSYRGVGSLMPQTRALERQLAWWHYDMYMLTEWGSQPQRIWGKTYLRSKPSPLFPAQSQVRGSSGVLAAEKQGSSKTQTELQQGLLRSSGRQQVSWNGKDTPNHPSFLCGSVPRGLVSNWSVPQLSGISLATFGSPGKCCLQCARLDSTNPMIFSIFTIFS